MTPIDVLKTYIIAMTSTSVNSLPMVKEVVIFDCFFNKDVVEEVAKMFDADIYVINTNPPEKPMAIFDCREQP